MLELRHRACLNVSVKEEHFFSKKVDLSMLFQIEEVIDISNVRGEF